MWHSWVFSCLFDGSLICHRTWDQIRRKYHHFLSKYHGNSMTWTCPKSMSCSIMENNKTWINDMETSWNLVSMRTKLPSICDMKVQMTWNFHENLCHTFYRVYTLFGFLCSGRSWQKENFSPFEWRLSVKFWNLHNK